MTGRSEPFDAFVRRVAHEHADTILVEVEHLRDALARIRDEQGAVCDAYETCDHRACRSSYAAWAIADEALSRGRS